MQGDMWDGIARRVYRERGAERLMHLLIGANPAHRETVVFGGGVVLAVPDVEIPVTLDLPPWKR